MKYAKGLAAAAATVLTALAAALADNGMSTVELINTLIVLCSAVGVVIVPDLDTGVARYAKPIVAALGAALTLLVTLIADGVTASEWIQVVLAGLGAVGVTALPGPKHAYTPPPTGSHAR